MTKAWWLVGAATGAAVLAAVVSSARNTDIAALWRDNALVQTVIGTSVMGAGALAIKAVLSWLIIIIVDCCLTTAVIDSSTLTAALTRFVQQHGVSSSSRSTVTVTCITHMTQQGALGRLRRRLTARKDVTAVTLAPATADLPLPVLVRHAGCRMLFWCSDKAMHVYLAGPRRHAELQALLQSIVDADVDPVVQAAEAESRAVLYRPDVSGQPRWSRAGPLPLRSPESLVLPRGMWEAMHGDLVAFFSEAAMNRYAALERPYRRALLLEGPPGTGKTTAIGVLAASLNMPLCLLPLNLPGLGDATLGALMATLPVPCLLVLEDVDVAAPWAVLRRDDRSTLTTPPPLSLSGLLNALDGVGTPQGFVSIMTTNAANRLDAALTRPGRIDATYTFDNATADQADRMFALAFPNAPRHVARQFAEVFKAAATTISPAELQEFLWRCETSSSAADAVALCRYLNPKPLESRGRTVSLYSALWARGYEHAFPWMLMRNNAAEELAGNVESSFDRAVMGLATRITKTSVALAFRTHFPNADDATTARFVSAVGPDIPICRIWHHLRINEGDAEAAIGTVGNWLTVRTGPGTVHYDDAAALRYFLRYLGVRSEALGEVMAALGSTCRPEDVRDIYLNNLTKEQRKLLPRCIGNGVIYLSQNDLPAWPTVADRVHIALILQDRFDLPFGTCLEAARRVTRPDGRTWLTTDMVRTAVVTCDGLDSAVEAIAAAAADLGSPWGVDV